MTEPIPSSPVLAAAALAARIQRFDLALFPTDTVPALAALPEAADRIWTIKQRPASKPLILMGADLQGLLALLDQPIHPDWIAMAERVWPGACTLVLPARGPLVAWLHPQGDSIGLRVPACDPALDLLQLTGPLATTSANRSGEEPCQNAEEAALMFPETPRLAPVPWSQGSGMPSTVLRWLGPGNWQRLRAGPVSPIPERPSAGP